MRKFPDVCLLYTISMISTYYIERIFQETLIKSGTRFYEPSCPSVGRSVVRSVGALANSMMMIVRRQYPCVRPLVTSSRSHLWLFTSKALWNDVPWILGSKVYNWAWRKNFDVEHVLTFINVFHLNISKCFKCRIYKCSTFETFEIYSVCKYNV